MKEIHTFYIGIGTNLSAAGMILRWTHRQLENTFQGKARYSRPLQTRPIDFPNPATFTNQLVVFETPTPREQVETLLKDIERLAGRTTTDKGRGIVRLDLDLLMADGEVIRPKDWQRPYIRQAFEELNGQEI
ncbi:MAG: 2-amino-4-hydroxy-6-hydroxymethyldihydropteridine diphosphokinase [Bacteroidaceae bacterium]|nr:2-amino-4-hydroxy-6-hydroxymethyldihydropteridine diphosphokinase [Bacteroidaceae bacterium]